MAYLNIFLSEPEYYKNYNYVEIEQFSKVEIEHLKFCKHILNLKSWTPNFMVYGELGRYPLIINVKVRMISFFGKLLNFQNSKLSAKLL